MSSINQPEGSDGLLRAKLVQPPTLLVLVAILLAAFAATGRVVLPRAAADWVDEHLVPLAIFLAGAISGAIVGRYLGQWYRRIRAASRAGQRPPQTPA
jgi:hypothetical protein